jgi:hypothetical protein
VPPMEDESVELQRKNKQSMIRNLETDIRSLGTVVSKRQCGRYLGNISHEVKSVEAVWYFNVKQQQTNKSLVIIIYYLADRYQYRDTVGNYSLRKCAVLFCLPR